MDILDPSKAEVASSPEGTMYMWRPAPGLLVTRVEGILDDKLAIAFEHMSRKIVAENGRMRGFHDWEKMTDYESEARLRLTGHGRSLGRSFEGATFLISSRLVSLGVQAASAVLTNMTVAASRQAFEADLREAIRARQTRPV